MFDVLLEEEQQTVVTDRQAAFALVLLLVARLWYWAEGRDHSCSELDYGWGRKGLPPSARVWYTRLKTFCDHTTKTLVTLSGGWLEQTVHWLCEYMEQHCILLAWEHRLWEWPLLVCILGVMNSAKFRQSKIIVTQSEMCIVLMEVTTSSIIRWIRAKVEWCDIVLDCWVTFSNNNMVVCEWKWMEMGLPNPERLPPCFFLSWTAPKFGTE